MTSCAGRWLHQNGRAQIFAWVSFVNAQQPMDSPPDGRKTADSGRFAVHSYPSSPQVGAARAFPHALFFSDPGAIFFSIPAYRSRAAANVECSAAVLTRRARFASPITFQMRRFAGFRTCSALCAFRTAAAFVCARNAFVLLRRRCAFDCADLAVSLRTPRQRRCVPAGPMPGCVCRLYLRRAVSMPDPRRIRPAAPTSLSGGPSLFMDAALWRDACRRHASRRVFAVYRPFRPVHL